MNKSFSLLILTLCLFSCATPASSTSASSYHASSQSEIAHSYRETYEQDLESLQDYFKKQGKDDIPDSYIWVALRMECTKSTVFAYSFNVGGMAFKVRSVLCGDQFLFRLPDTSCFALFLDKNGDEIDYMEEDDDILGECLVFPEWTLDNDDILKIRNAFAEFNRWDRSLYIR